MTSAAPTPPDLVVLGGGSAGYACALRAADLGLTVVLVEAGELGGTCLHRGCIPTKAWLHAAEVADAARHGERFGIRSRVDGVDVPALRRYADQVVERLHTGLSGLVRARGIEVVTGWGRLERTGEQIGVRVGEQLLRAPHLVLATGSRPRTLPDIATDGHRVVDSDQALRLDSLPERAVVLGGGVIGCEFASAWASLGVEVTLVEATDRLLPEEQPAASQALQRAFARRGIAIRLGAGVEAVGHEDEQVLVQLADGERLSAGLLLLAVGREPVSDTLGADEVGLEIDRGAVVVDDRLATSLPGVWAGGDVVGGLQLAHRGFGHGLFLAEEIAHRLGRLDRRPSPTPDHAVPRVTYCDPEVASVGLTTARAQAVHGEVVELRYDLTGNGRSQILQTSGFVQLVRVVDGPVVGVHLVGSRVSELVAEAQLVVGWEAWPEEVAALIHPHPTQSEALGEAHLALAGRPLHVHG